MLALFILFFRQCFRDSGHPARAPLALGGQLFDRESGGGRPARRLPRHAAGSRLRGTAHSTQLRFIALFSRPCSISVGPPTPRAER